MAPEPNFKSRSLNPFSNNNNFSDGNQDLDVNFFLDNILFLNTECFSPSDVKIGFSKFESFDTFSILHLSIRRLCNDCFPRVKIEVKARNLLTSKSMDWFLYDNGLRLERVKTMDNQRHCKVM